ncbi:MAG: 4Fe-4S dicluster domain-containing protein [Syntrophotaleaceae bacterium]
MEKDQRIEWEAKCIQEEPPACTATCPLHVDVRQFMLEISKGDLEAAYQVLKKHMPFPGIFGRICNHPCETRCRRAEVGQALAIGSLERLCVEKHGSPDPVKPLPRKNKHIAVIGGDIAGLVAAHDLRKKGFAVTLFEPEKILGKTFRKFPDNLLPAAIIDEELSVLEGMKVEIVLGDSINQAVFDRLCSEFDAIFIDRSSSACSALALAKDDQGEMALDPASAATSVEGVFAGGCAGDAPIMLAAAGRKGALSIERFLQKAHMTIGREDEGPFETRLFTNLEGIEPLDRIAPARPDSGYTPDEAAREAERCIQCECMECVKVCQYLAHYKKYPKKYIREIFNNEKVLLGAAHTSNQFINSCTDCGLCAHVCPNNLSMGEICRQERQFMLQEKFMPPSAHEFPLQDMAFSTGDDFSLCRHQPGTNQSAYLYFPSCMLCATAPQEVLTSYDCLCESLSGGVGILLGCCGAPAYWSGREELFRETLAGIRKQWQDMGMPQMITACCSCQTLFKEHLPEIPVTPLWQTSPVQAIGAGNGEKSKQPIAVVDPCISRDDPKTQTDVRAILTGLGYRIEELPLSGDMAECCGYGGLVFNANPQLDNAIVTRRAAESERDYLAYCAMCRDKFVAAGKRTAHLIELLFSSSPDNDPWARGWLSWTDRRTNRLRVKQDLLTRHGETAERAMESYEHIKLYIEPEVMRSIDSRRILENDLRQVIAQAEKTGRRLFNKEMNCFRANSKLGNTTFWVDYRAEQDGFRVLKAFSHRMVITGVES